jgi:hypothetical protein
MWGVGLGDWGFGRWRIDLDDELHRLAAIVGPRQGDVPVRGTCHGGAGIIHVGAGPHDPEWELEFAHGREAPLADLRRAGQGGMAGSYHLGDAGEGNPCARAFAQEQRKGIALPRMPVDGCPGHLKCGHTPGHRSGTSLEVDRCRGTPRHHEQQAHQPQPHETSPDPCQYEGVGGGRAPDMTLVCRAAKRRPSAIGPPGMNSGDPRVMV